MGNNYREEYEMFAEKFSTFKDQRIILYGIGRFTSTLVPYLADWNIVGVMDRNPENVGKNFFGLPVLSVEEVKKKADIIIINTSGTYWNIIYERIKSVGLPIYYRDGRIAKEQEGVISELDYWNRDLEELLDMVRNYNIISFDFFDTLFHRTVYLPEDIFFMVSNQIIDIEVKTKYLLMRKNISMKMRDENYTLDDIYYGIQQETLWESKLIEWIKQKEIEIESRMIVPRYKMIEVLKLALQLKKSVFIISDMYLPMYFYENIFRFYNLEVPKDNIWISCEKKVCKRNGSIWEKFEKEIVGNNKALHIGDDIISDKIMVEKKSKITTFFIMSKNEMFQNSSIKSLLPCINKRYHSALYGMCISRLFNNPFALNKSKGLVNLNKREDMGYYIFAPILYTFFIWIKDNINKEIVNKIIFLGRDGYFLKEDFDLFTNGEENITTSYMEVSRQILLCAAINSIEDFIEYIKFPYMGTFSNFIEDRFGVHLCEKDELRIGKNMINSQQSYPLILEWIIPYQSEIEKFIEDTKREYKKYIEKFEINSNTAIIDLGYYGTTQRVLSNVIGKKTIGYYIIANMSDKNPNIKDNKMKSCVMDQEDGSSQNTNLYEKLLVLESFLTSPRGMIRGMKNKGEFIYDMNNKNQFYFEDKREINDGIKNFIEDMQYYYGNLFFNNEEYIDFFVDKWYGVFLDKTVLSEDIKRSFYNDNAFVHRGEERIFE